MEASRASLDEKIRGRKVGTAPPHGAAAAAAATSMHELATLRARLLQAERDVKAYKSRLRTQEASDNSSKELQARVADLERRLLAAEGQAAMRGSELDEMRRRAVTAEATAAALRDELRRDVDEKAGGRHEKRELILRISEIETELQSARLERATVRPAAGKRTGPP